MPKVPGVSRAKRLEKLLVAKSADAVTEEPGTSGRGVSAAASVTSDKAY